MEQSQLERETRIIAVGNQKGGVAKTTNTVHLATALGAVGRRCLIWDLDMNHGATLHFGIPSEGFLGTFDSILKFFSLAIRAVLIFQVLHSIRATHNHSVAFS